MKIDGFIAGMAVAIALALVAPSIGADGSPIPFDAITQIGIALVFFLHGANLSPEALKAGASNWRLHLLVQATTFLIFPVLGLVIFVFSRGLLPPDIAMGFFFLCAVSSTISSAVAMVAMARGAVAAAVFNASLSSLLGMLITPALIGLVQAGAGEVPLAESVLQIGLKLLAPFILGQVLRPYLATFIARWKPWITKLDKGVIVLIIYTAFCQSTKDGVWSTFTLATLLQVLGLATALLLVALGLTTLLSRKLGFSTEDEITAIICGSQKSLAGGAPIAKILFGVSPALGAILLPLLVYHQLQLVVCSILAKRYAQRGQSSSPPIGMAQDAVV